VVRAGKLLGYGIAEPRIARHGGGGGHCTRLKVVVDWI
jgi:hypothetical protein